MRGLYVIYMIYNNMRDLYVAIVADLFRISHLQCVESFTHIGGCI